MEPIAIMLVLWAIITAVEDYYKMEARIRIIVQADAADDLIRSIM